MIKKMLVFILLLMLPAFAGAGERQNRELLFSGPEPRLLYPTAEVIDLKGRDNLEFKWNVYGGGYLRIDSYEFKLYRGYNTTFSSLILKNQLPANTYTIEIDSEVFVNNEVYTWGVRGIFRDGRKSDFVFASFKIIKK